MKTPNVVIIGILVVIIGFLLIYSLQHEMPTATAAQGHGAAAGYASSPSSGSGGYGTAPKAGGYGAAPASSGYGSAPAAGGYGAAPAATGGHGAASGGYGAPASGGYGK